MTDDPEPELARLQDQADQAWRELKAAKSRTEEWDDAFLRYREACGEMQRLAYEWLTKRMECGE